MTFIEWINLEEFPIEMIILGDYQANDLKLKAGDSFTAIGKKKIGEDDYSIIDSNGHPHYYDGCIIKK